MTNLAGGGSARSWTVAAGYGVELFDWNPGSRHVVLLESRTGLAPVLRVLDTTKAEGPLEAVAPVVRGLSPGCIRLSATYAPSGRIAVAEGCKSSSRILLLPTNVTSGRPSVVAVLSGVSEVWSLYYDLDGSALLLTGGLDPATFRIEKGKATKLPTVGASEPYWQ